MSDECLVVNKIVEAVVDECTEILIIQSYVLFVIFDGYKDERDWSSRRKIGKIEALILSCRRFGHFWCAPRQGCNTK